MYATTIVVLRFACKKDVYHSLANIDEKRFFLFLFANTHKQQQNLTRSRVQYFSYSLPFPVCHAVQNALSELMVCHITHAFLFPTSHTYTFTHVWKQ